MKKISINFFLALFLLISFAANAQDSNDVLMTIGKEKVTVAEFDRIYNKNNNSNTIDNKSVDEYMDLFTNFKLKVLEAKSRGMDTLESFKTELSGYRDQLAKPYLTDPEIEEELIKESYDRMKYEVDASHIMIRLAENASPKDTLDAWNKIMEIRKRIMKGEEFSAIAMATSDDPSAKQNGGHIGYFSAFDMVYPFETAAFNTKVGEVSLPVRTRFGYHLVKVLDKRPGLGEVKVAHIMVATPNNAPASVLDSAKIKIDKIYNELKNGSDFKLLASKYSDDRGTAQNGGVMPFFKSGRMVPEFEVAAFALKNNFDVSEPIKTAYGWHIIKLIERRGTPPFEEANQEIKSKLTREDHAGKGQEMYVEKLKKQYNYKSFPENLLPFYSIVDSTVYNKNWETSKAKDLQKELFVIDNKPFTQQDFATYISKSSVAPGSSIEYAVNAMYGKFEQESIIAYENSLLEKKYPEFRYLMEEYHDGILLFDLTDQMVWTKAVKDTVGLESFYNQHKNEYMWGERAKVNIYTIDSVALNGAAKAIKKAEKKNLGLDYLTTTLCPNDTTHSCVNLKKDTFEKGVNDLMNKVEWKKGLYGPINYNNAVVMVSVTAILPPQPKKLDETRGLITADYQNFLEKQWITELKGKYKVEVNEPVLQKLKEKYK